MSTFRRVATRDVVFVLALIGSALLLGWMTGRSALLVQLLAPAWRIVEQAVTSGKLVVGRFERVSSLQAENVRLRDQVSALQADLARVREHVLETERHAHLTNLATPGVEQGVVAHVVARSPVNWHQVCTIDRGAEDGIGIDSVVLSGDGVCGRVQRVSAHAAVVGLLTDIGQACGILDQRSRSPAVLQGQGNLSLQLAFMPQQVDWRVGDLLVTSGYGGIYPRGLPVGRVARVEQSPGAPSPTVEVTLTTDLDRLEIVRVLAPRQRFEEP